MNDFCAVSTRVLEELAEIFEASWHLADVDLLEGVLTVTLPEQHHYVIHKHGITQQIWMASPFTGAHHFHLKEGEWRCTRTGRRLQDLIKEEHETYAT